MGKNKNFKIIKTTKKCCYSGKDVAGHQVILIRFAKDYVRQLGCILREDKDKYILKEDAIEYVEQALGRSVSEFRVR